MYSRILVTLENTPADDSILAHVRKLAAHCGASVVLIHVADPVAFFEPIDETNERWEELRRHPDWSFHGPGFPTHGELLAALMRQARRVGIARLTGEMLWANRPMQMLAISMGFVVEPVARDRNLRRLVLALK